MELRRATKLLLRSTNSPSLTSTLTSFLSSSSSTSFTSSSSSASINRIHAAAFLARRPISTSALRNASPATREKEDEDEDEDVDQDQDQVSEEPVVLPKVPTGRITINPRFLKQPKPKTTTSRSPRTGVGISQLKFLERGKKAPEPEDDLDEFDRPVRPPKPPVPTIDELLASSQALKHFKGPKELAAEQSNAEQQQQQQQQVQQSTRPTSSDRPMAPLANLFADMRSSRTLRPNESRRLDTRRMLDPFATGATGPGASTAAASPTADRAGAINALLSRNPEHMQFAPDMSAPSFRITPALGRTVPVDATRNVDLARAFRLVDIKCNANSVRQDALRQRFHERGGMKRKRLAMSRWRRRFKEAFRETVRRVEDMRRKGW